MQSQPKLLGHRAALCNTIRRIADEAGELILEYFDGVHGTDTIKKEDGSPVTIADKEAEKLIDKKLNEILPEVPVIGEESFSAGRRINFDDHDYFWLVDPLDGTRAFARGEPEFTVNIGLIYKKQPVLGVVYAPEKGELYAGFIEEDGTGKAFRYYEDSETEKDISVRPMPSEGLTVMSSSFHGKAKAQNEMLQQFKVKKILRQSSSIKLCTVANGKADVYPRFGPTCEWDTAAGHAILRAAGGDIRDLKGQPLAYGGTDEKLLNPDFIAASLDFFDAIDLESF